MNNEQDDYIVTGRWHEKSRFLVTEGSLLRSNIFTIGETFILIALRIQPFHKVAPSVRFRYNFCLLAKRRYSHREYPTIASDGPPFRKRDRLRITFNSCEALASDIRRPETKKHLPKQVLFQAMVCLYAGSESFLSSTLTFGPKSRTYSPLQK